jgi:hypothetical protein
MANARRRDPREVARAIGANLAAGGHLVGGPAPGDVERDAHRETTGRIPLYDNIKLEAVPDDGVIIMMLGDEVPVCGTALDANNARKLAMALLADADRLPTQPVTGAEPAEGDSDGTAGSDLLEP